MSARVCALKKTHCPWEEASDEASSLARRYPPLTPPLEGRGKLDVHTTWSGDDGIGCARHSPKNVRASSLFAGEYSFVVRSLTQFAISSPRMRSKFAHRP